MSNLFELTQDYQKLQWLLEDPEADPEVIKDTMEMLEGDIEAKADSYAWIIRNMEADIDAIKKEKGRLEARKQTLENGIARLKQNLMDAMRTTGKLKFKTATNSFGIQKAGGVQPIELDVKPEELPKEYQKVEVKADMDKIRDLLVLTSASKDAQCSYAHFKERSEFLKIR